MDFRQSVMVGFYQRGEGPSESRGFLDLLNSCQLPKEERVACINSDSHFWLAVWSLCDIMLSKMLEYERSPFLLI